MIEGFILKSLLESEGFLENVWLSIKLQTQQKNHFILNCFYNFELK